MELQPLPVANSLDDDTRLVAQSHELTECYYDLDLVPYQLMVIALSAVDFSKPWDGKIEIKPIDFSKATGGEPKRSVPKLRQAAKGLLESQVIFPYIDDEKGKSRRIRSYTWLEYADVTFEESHEPVILKFSSALIPHLSMLGVALSDGDKTKFTTISRQSALALSGPFAFHLYMRLNLEINLDRRKLRNGSHLLPITVELLALICGVSFSRWADFKRRHLDPAVNSITENTDIDVAYKVVKNNKSIVGIEFNFRRSGSEVVIDGKAGSHKPLKPRLSRKPKDEGKLIEWASNNLKLLVNYDLELKRHDPETIIPIKLLRDIVKFSRLVAPDSNRFESYEIELAEREGKLNDRKMAKLNSSLKKFIAEFGDVEMDYLSSPKQHIALTYYWPGSNVGVLIKDKDGKDVTTSLAIVSFQSELSLSDTKYITVSLEQFESMSDEIIESLKALCDRPADKP